MNIFITGGTGFVGTTLSASLAARGHRVTILTRPGERKDIHATETGISYFTGDPTVEGPWQEEASRHEVFINLAGTNIFTRWNEQSKRLIRESRIYTTNNLVAAIGRRKGAHSVLFSTSAVGYYGFNDDEILNESSPAGNDFLASLAVEWERTAERAAESGARVVACRFGIVLGRGGGALRQMLPLAHLGLASPLGSGNQWFSWIHEGDLVRIYQHLLAHSEIHGAVNFTSPKPVRNGEYTKILTRVLGRPSFLPPVPAFALRLILGEFGSVLLKGQRVHPEKLLKSGFIFSFPLIEDTLRDLVLK
ncbi:MAG: TIGR01777 family oxidoreductase [Deltaproteobacteria bacterium]|nr:TIGR01777 family oxidoreductase [Deltaproteobacteria bacterium]